MSKSHLVQKNDKVFSNHFSQQKVLCEGICRAVISMYFWKKHFIYWFSDWYHSASVVLKFEACIRITWRTCGHRWRPLFSDSGNLAGLLECVDLAALPSSGLSHVTVPLLPLLCRCTLSELLWKTLPGYLCTSSSECCKTKFSPGERALGILKLVGSTEIQWAC